MNNVMKKRNIPVIKYFFFIANNRTEIIEENKRKAYIMHSRGEWKQKKL